MPLLDSCINGLFEPGNIGSSSGTPPTVITPGSLEDPATYDPEAVIYSLDYSKFYNSMYLLLLMVGGGGSGDPALDTSPYVTISASDTNQDNFKTWNQTDNGEGPYWIGLDGWNTLAPWTLSITAHTGTFPNGGVLFSWSFPPYSGGVYAYPEIVYGQTGYYKTTNHPAVLQISSIASMSVTFDWSKSFGADDSDIMMEVWSFNNSAALPEHTTNEISFFAYMPTTFRNSQLADGGPRELNYSAGGFNAFCINPSASGTGTAGSPPQILIIPVTAPSGRTYLEMTSGTFPVKDVLIALRDAGWLSGTDYIVGGEFGIEPFGNSGTATLNSISWTWN